MSIPDLLGVALDIFSGTCLGAGMLAWMKLNLRRGLHRRPRFREGQDVLVLEEDEQGRVVDAEPCGRIWVELEDGSGVVAWYTEDELELVYAKESNPKSRIHAKEVVLQ